MTEESFPDWLERTKRRLENMMSKPTTESDVVAWVIEHPNNGKQRPFYWGVEEGEESWTGDIEAAHKFASAEDAEKWAGDMGVPDYQSVDHKWLDHKPTTKSVVDGERA